VAGPTRERDFAVSVETPLFTSETRSNKPEDEDDWKEEEEVDEI
jgi:hypothetical protein